MEMFSLNWEQMIGDLIRVGVAFLLALPIAWERTRSKRSFGLRTFSLVAIASCGYMLVAKSLAGESVEAQARIIQGLMTGIGFIGGGAILKQDTNVHGLATAASIWNTGAIGAAVAFERTEIAIILSLINFLVLFFFTPLVENTDKEEEEANSSEGRGV
jgi:putative Mg2+ transporter-C (MgtC) family protein